jgi:hypothetical protein
MEPDNATAQSETNQSHFQLLETALEKFANRVPQKTEFPDFASLIKDKKTNKELALDHYGQAVDFSFPSGEIGTYLDSGALTVNLPDEPILIPAWEACFVAQAELITQNGELLVTYHTTDRRKTLIDFYQSLEAIGRLKHFTLIGRDHVDKNHTAAKSAQIMRDLPGANIETRVLESAVPRVNAVIQNGAITVL